MCSRRLQRVLVDFGAESAFAPASHRVREHYGIEMPVSAVRDCTLRHGKAIAVVAEEIKPRRNAKTIVTEMDGSMVPIVQAGSGSDGRKGKTVFWREARLCCARSAQEVEPVYGVTLGTVELAGWLWRQTAQLAGWESKTFVHGVGDGASWIVDKFEENFGEQGNYLIDFYHVSEYLSAAAQKVAYPGKEQQWRGADNKDDCSTTAWVRCCAAWKSTWSRKRMQRLRCARRIAICRKDASIWIMRGPAKENCPSAPEKSRAAIVT
jgi:hypothetical protein